jgi:hypothetical protein
MGHMKFEHTHTYESDFGKQYQFGSKLSLSSVKTEKSALLNNTVPIN